MESSVLLAMAFDHIVTICKALKYARIFTNSRITKVGVMIFVCMLFNLIPLLLLLNGLSFYGPNMLFHSYCYHQDVL